MYKIYVVCAEVKVKDIFCILKGFSSEKAARRFMKEEAQKEPNMTYYVQELDFEGHQQEELDDSRCISMEDHIQKQIINLNPHFTNLGDKYK